MRENDIADRMAKVALEGLEEREQEIADLRAKLEQAGRDIARYKNVINRQSLRGIDVIGKMEQAQKERNELSQKNGQLESQVAEQTKRIEELNDLGFKFPSIKTLECKHCGWAFTQYGKEEICHVCERKFAKLGQSVIKGVNEVMPHTLCKGIYQSDHCNGVNSDPYGCVLKYYCKSLVGGVTHAS